MLGDIEQSAAAIAVEMRIFAAVGRRDLPTIEVDEHGRGAPHGLAEMQHAAAAQQCAGRTIRVGDLRCAEDEEKQNSENRIVRGHPARFQRSRHFSIHPAVILKVRAKRASKGR